MDYDNMPAGLEMDALVAELVFGAELRHLPSFNGGGEMSSDGLWTWANCLWCGARMPNGILGGKCLQAANQHHYSTDISEAFTVVRWMIGSCQQGFFIESWGDGEWFVASRPVGYSGREPYASCDGKATGEPSLPLAICRWALKTTSPQPD